VTVAERVEIEVTLTPDGEVRIVTHGLKGQACLAETDALEKALGEVRSREKTAEYYQQSSSSSAAVKRRP
jgi:hypothetical protein